MKFKHILIFSLLVWASKAHSQVDTTTVLFVGSSHVGDRLMREMLQEMFQEKRQPIKIYSDFLIGDLGMHLGIFVCDNNLSQKEGLNRLRKDRIDYLVLQETYPNILIPKLRKKSHENIRQISHHAKLYNPQIKVILFQNYSTNHYPDIFCLPNTEKSAENPEDIFCSDELESSTQETKIIEDSFREISKQIQAKVAPVATAFEVYKNKFTHQKLISDRGAPSRFGNYLMACVFYRTITNQPWDSSSFAYEFGIKAINDVKETIRLVVVE